MRLRPDGGLAVTLAADLVAVHCRNAVCPFALKRGKPMLVGRISTIAELRCPSCRTVDTYRV